MHPLIILLLAALLALIALVLIRAFTFSRPGFSAPAVESPAIDIDAAALHLSHAVRCQTISWSEQQCASPESLNQLRQTLKADYPLAHQQLTLHTINQFSLVYEWTGSDASLEPVLFMAHQDVVPVDEATLDRWEQAPFSGEITGGFVWGRGTLDVKNQVTSLLDAVEYLLARGYRPTRGIFLAFGHDEEISGRQGACQVADWFASRGVKFNAILDEGLAVVENTLPGVHTPVALVGNTEKGYLTLKLDVETDAGHSSTPPAETSIGILASALARLQNNPQPARVEMMVPLFQALGPTAPFVMRMVFANLWLFGGLARKQLDASPQTSAAIRTTTAPTILSAGMKDNVLPRSASAQVNFRLLPGDSIQTVVKRVRQTIHDPRVKIEVIQGSAREPSPVSPSEGNAYLQLAYAIQQTFGPVPVAPFAMLGASDAYHYISLSSHVYRFSPVRLESKDLSRVHGLNERISLENLANMIRFYILLMQSWGK
jgi:carboxypeptidase PM20D1